MRLDIHGVTLRNLLILQPERSKHPRHKRNKGEKPAQKQMTDCGAYCAVYFTGLEMARKLLIDQEHSVFQSCKKIIMIFFKNRILFI